MFIIIIFFFFYDYYINYPLELVTKMKLSILNLHSINNKPLHEIIKLR